MQRIRRFMGSFLLAATIIGPVVIAGCAARVRYYDADYRDYHRWDAREDRAYHRYWDERRERYRDWKELNEKEQRDYWRWRHDHPDRD
jgi:hypothetical protein